MHDARDRNGSRHHPHPITLRIDENPDPWRNPSIRHRPPLLLVGVLPAVCFRVAIGK